VTPSEDEVKELAGLLKQGNAITILWGCWVCRSPCATDGTGRQTQVANRLGLTRSGTLQYDNPYDVGLTGLIGFSSGYHAIMEADTLLMLSTDFPYTQFYPEKATIIQVDRRGANLGRSTRLDLGIIGYVKATLSALVPLLDQKEDYTT
jgi:pyruvate dehydrogenase (quinone)